MYLILYILIMLILTGIALVLNFKNEWITQDDFEFDPPTFIFLSFMALLFWPITLVLAAVAGLGYLIYKYCLPE
jgi:hypothetical protein